MNQCRATDQGTRCPNPVSGNSLWCDRHKGNCRLKSDFYKSIQIPLDTIQIESHPTNERAIGLAAKSLQSYHYFIDQELKRRAVFEDQCIHVSVRNQAHEDYKDRLMETQERITIELTQLSIKLAALKAQQEEQLINSLTSEVPSSTEGGSKRQRNRKKLTEIPQMSLAEQVVAAEEEDRLLEQESRINRMTKEFTYAEKLIDSLSVLMTQCQEPPLSWLRDLISLSLRVGGESLNEYDIMSAVAINMGNILTFIRRMAVSAGLTNLMPSYLVFEEVSNTLIKNAPSIATVESVSRFVREVPKQAIMRAVMHEIRVHQFSVIDKLVQDNLTTERNFGAPYIFKRLKFIQEHSVGWPNTLDQNFRNTIASLLDPSLLGF